MRYYADIHVHSRFSMATAGDMTPEGIWLWARIKGISVVGTGDFTHPGWLKELGGKLEATEGGLLSIKRSFKPENPGVPNTPEPLFILSAEVSCIYKREGRTRRVHCVLLTPSFKDAEAINHRLAAYGKLASDGRPILKLDARDLLSILIEVSPESMLIPAHVWTPHFSMFGETTGFESLEECFGELAGHISAVETGLSSDPAMNWRVGVLDGVTLVSNSDAHSPRTLGREANILDTERTYEHITKAIRTGKGFVGTVEFYPELGKYHVDGHRKCGVSMEPSESMKNDLMCPVCGKKLIVGVMNRVERMADRKQGAISRMSHEVHYAIPLRDVLSRLTGRGVNTKTVEKEYFRLVEALGPELYILVDAPLADIEKNAPKGLAEYIGAMREGRVRLVPGYDGVYGTADFGFGVK